MIKILLFLSPFFVFPASQSVGQATFQKTYGGVGHSAAFCVRLTSDGGYILSGTTDSLGAGGTDFYVVRTNWDGDTLWAKTYGGSGDESGPYVEETADGGFVVAGYTTSFGAAGNDILVIKLSSNGDLQWSKVAGGVSDDRAKVIHQLPDGSYIIGGTTTSFGAGGTDFYLVKLNNNGSFAWSKVYGTTGENICNDFQLTSDGGFVMAGTTDSTGTSDGTDICVIKIDSTGNLTWSKKIGTTKGDYANCIIQTSDDGYAIGGLIDKGVQGDNVLLIKLTSTGTSSFAKSYDKSASDGCNSIKQTADHGFVLAGYCLSSGLTNYDVFLLKTDSAGTIFFSKSYGGLSDEVGNCIEKVNDGGYVMAGNTYSFGSSAESFYLVKTDGTGSSGCNQLVDTAIAYGQVLTVANLSLTVTIGGTANDALPVVSGGGDFNVICHAIGVEEIDNISSIMSVYPNPASLAFTVFLTGEKVIIDGELMVCDVLGQKIYSDKINGHNSLTIQENFPAGIYFVIVNDGNRQAVQKVVIE